MLKCWTTSGGAFQATTNQRIRHVVVTHACQHIQYTLFSSSVARYMYILYIHTSEKLCVTVRWSCAHVTRREWHAYNTNKW